MFPSQPPGGRAADRDGDDDVDSSSDTSGEIGVDRVAPFPASEHTPDPDPDEP